MELMRFDSRYEASCHAKPRRMEALGFAAALFPVCRYVSSSANRTQAQLSEPTYLLAKRERIEGRNCVATTCNAGGLCALSLLMVLVLPLTKAEGQSREEAVRAARDGHIDE